ncbi:unnamed protein product [Penicillium viridicatum]
MAKLSWIWLLLISVSQVVRSDGTRRDRWVKPNGENIENFKERYYIGDTLNIEWKGWNTTETEGFVMKNGETRAKLYVRAWDPGYSSWSDFRTSNVNIASGGSYEWKVDVPDDVLFCSSRFAVTFIPNDQNDFSFTGPHISSPGFGIPGFYVDTKSTTTSSISVNASTTTSTSSTEARASSSTSELPTGTKAGIGIGVSFGGLAVLAALAFLMPAKLAHVFKLPLRWIKSLTIKWERVSTSPPKKQKPTDIGDGALGEGTDPQETDKAQKSSEWTRLSSDTWLWEASAVILSILCLTAIFCVVRVYDQKASPSLPYGITLNSVISILGTASKSSLIFAVGESLGQLKWMWFWRAKRRLRDLQSFDSASRGPWGSIIMLFQHKGTSIASLGALIIILALAFDPFLQQVLTFPLRQTPSLLNPNSQFSSFSQVHNILPLWGLDPTPGYSYWTSKEQEEYITNFREAILSGIWSSQPQMNPTCASANCTWEPFRSVGYCAKCADLTTSARLTGCDNMSFPYSMPFNTTTIQTQSTNCSISLPQGKPFPLNMTFALSNDTVDRVYEQIMPRYVVWEIHNTPQIYNTSENTSVPNSTFLGVDNPLLVFGQAEIDYDIPERDLVPRPEQIERKLSRVTECVLSLCSRTYNVSVKNGNAKVEVSSPDFGETWFPNRWTSIKYPRPANMTHSPKFQESGLANWDICWKQWKGHPFPYQPFPYRQVRLSRSSRYPPAQIIESQGSAFCNVNSLAPDILQYIGGTIYNRFAISPHQIYWGRSSGTSDLNSSDVFERAMRLGLEKMMNNIADSLTNLALRETLNKSNGTPYVSEVYVQVHWPWVALPAAVIVLSSVLLIATARITKSQDRRLWKTSSLPILYHGLDEDLLKDTEEYSTLSKMETTADSTNVGLELSDTNGRVLLQR